MCFEYELREDTFQAALPFLRQTMPFAWAGPEPDPAKFRIRVGDQGGVVKLDGGRLVGERMTWGWEDGRQIVFNLKSEDVDFFGGQRIGVLAEGYCEYTEPMEPRILGHERHFFTMRRESWFVLAGVARSGRFCLLTSKAGPDVRPYRSRQACALPPSALLDWLKLGRPRDDMLRPGPVRTMRVRTSYGASTFAIPNGADLYDRTRQRCGPAIED